MRRLRISLRAQRQLAAAARWWERNRSKAPAAFEEDVADAYKVIAESPGIGKPVRSKRSGLRRVLLERIRYYLYYRVAADGAIEVIALWHTSRRPPTL